MPKEEFSGLPLVLDVGEGKLEVEEDEFSVLSDVEGLLSVSSLLFFEVSVGEKGTGLELVVERVVVVVLVVLELEASCANLEPKIVKNLVIEGCNDCKYN